MGVANHNNFKHLACLILISITTLVANAEQTKTTSHEIHSVYLTWDSEDTSTTMSVHALTQNKFPISIQLNDSQKKTESMNSTLQPINNTPLFVHTFSFKKLLPNSLYTFHLSLPDGNNSKKYTFKTLPNDKTPIEIVQGGDMTTSPDIVTIAKPVITKNTAAILIGGDIAYANGETKNFKMWLDWFSLMNQVMISPDGRLIPLIIAVGNHDANKSKNVPPLTKAPFYFPLFWQNQTTSYFQRNIGDHAQLFVLDTGHVADQGGTQSQWLESALKNSKPGLKKLALYHVPLYPSVRDQNDEGSVRTRKHWLPLFDRYGLDVALENHDHSLKRTHPLKQGEVVAAKGTVYVGDGCWGVAPRPTHALPYLAKYASENHLWRIVFEPSKVTFTAIGKNGVKLDDFHLNVQ